VILLKIVSAQNFQWRHLFQEAIERGEWTDIIDGRKTNTTVSHSNVIFIFASSIYPPGRSPPKATDYTFAEKDL
jgi:hypothetical protein